MSDVERAEHEQRSGDGHRGRGGDGEPALARARHEPEGGREQERDDPHGVGGPERAQQKKGAERAGRRARHVGRVPRPGPEGTAREDQRLREPRRDEGDGLGDQHERQVAPVELEGIVLERAASGREGVDDPASALDVLGHERQEHRQREGRDRAERPDEERRADARVLRLDVRGRRPGRERAADADAEQRDGDRPEGQVGEQDDREDTREQHLEEQARGTHQSHEERRSPQTHVSSSVHRSRLVQSVVRRTSDCASGRSGGQGG